MLLSVFCLFTQIILLTGDKSKKPEISLLKTSLSEKETLDVTCDIPKKTPFECSLHLDGQRNPMKTESVSSGLCELQVTWEELVNGRTDMLPYTTVRLSCGYSVGGQHWEQSNMTEVKLLAKMKAPQLTVKPNVIRKGDTAELHCLVPPSISRCYFLIGGKNDQTPSECLRSYSWDDLHQTGNHSADTEIKVQCKYSVLIDGHESPSPDSNVSIVTLLGVTLSSTVHPVVTSANSTADPASGQSIIPVVLRIGITVAVLLLGAPAFILFWKHRNAASQQRGTQPEQLHALSPDSSFELTARIAGGDD